MTTATRTERRRGVVRDEVVETAWALAREGGVAGGGNGRPAPGAQEEWGVVLAGRTYSVTLLDPQRRRGVTGPPVQEGPVEVRAIMPGRITTLLVKEGQEVRSGQGVLVVEAMKMENELLAPKEGRVTRIRVRPGETVEAGAGLFTVE